MKQVDQAFGKSILECAANLLETKGWCQGGYAQDAAGFKVAIDDPEAASFCALGAIYRCFKDRNVHVSFDIWTLLFDPLIYAVKPELKETSLAAFNDSSGTTKEMVVTLLREASNSQGA